LTVLEEDATIARALEDLSIPTLVLSLVHMTGNPKWIRGEIKPQGLFLNEVQGFMPEEMQAEAREVVGRMQAAPARDRAQMRSRYRARRAESRRIT
jgi:4-hydroxyacetophenone monooxygenase